MRVADDDTALCHGRLLRNAVRPERNDPRCKCECRRKNRKRQEIAETVG